MFITRSLLLDFLAHLDAAFGRPGRVLLVGETSLLLEERRPWVDEIELTAEVAPEDEAAFAEAVQAASEATGAKVWVESPADVIPLPDGFEERHRAVALEGNRLQHLTLAHFDPYSVAYRYIARGDEPDYHLALSFVEMGWVSIDELDARLDALLPRFSMTTIQQDPAEFRRKYKGLWQMAHAIAPGTLHRHTPA